MFKLALILFCFLDIVGKCPECGLTTCESAPRLIEQKNNINITPKLVIQPVQEKRLYALNIPNTYPSWTWPGNLYNHLLREHNINTKYWPQSERVKLHNYLHNMNKKYGLSQKYNPIQHKELNFGY